MRTTHRELPIIAIVWALIAGIGAYYELADVIYDFDRYYLWAAIICSAMVGYFGVQEMIYPIEKHDKGRGMD
jgi:hypothetical protein